MRGIARGLPSLLQKTHRASNSSRVSRRSNASRSPLAVSRAGRPSSLCSVARLSAEPGPISPLSRRSAFVIPAERRGASSPSKVAPARRRSVRQHLRRHTFHASLPSFPAFSCASPCRTRRGHTPALLCPGAAAPSGGCGARSPRRPGRSAGSRPAPPPDGGDTPAFSRSLNRAKPPTSTTAASTACRSVFLSYRPSTTMTSLTRGFTSHLPVP